MSINVNKWHDNIAYGKYLVFIVIYQLSIRITEIRFMGTNVFECQAELNA